MIVKIMDAAGSNFPGVRYNDKKIDNGSGQLMLMKNFPSFINENSSTEDVRNYLASVSKSRKVTKPQFHAAISTKFKDHSKEELTKITEDFMKEMGYGEQPFIVVFHNDTENNHVHIVSTRVDKSSGKKLNDSYEKLKSQKALSIVMERLFGINDEKNIEKLINYKYSSINQLITLLEKNGYKIIREDENEKFLYVLKNGVKLKKIEENNLKFLELKDEPRAKQLRAILTKFKNKSIGKVFKVEDRREPEGLIPVENQKLNDDLAIKIEFQSELINKLKVVFGIDIVFHHNGNKPFGYSLIDNKSGSVFKGSEIVKMNDLFQFTDDKIDKRLFESLKDFNISNITSKQVLLKYLKENYPENIPKDFMLFETKKVKQKKILNEVREDVKEYLKLQNVSNVKIIKSEDDKLYAVHTKHHYVGELESLIGEKNYQNLIDNNHEKIIETKNKTSELNKSVKDMIYQIFKPSGGSGSDPAENENKKRRRKKR